MIGLLSRILRNVLIRKEKQKVLTLFILVSKFTWSICRGSIVTGGLGQAFKLWGDPSRMRCHKELLWCLPELQDLGEHGYLLIRVLNALGQNTNHVVTSRCKLLDLYHLKFVHSTGERLTLKQ